MIPGVMKTVVKPQYRERVGYQAMLLGGFTTLATALLVVANITTQDAINARQQEDLQSSLNQVIPASVYSNNLLDAPLTINSANGKQWTVYRGTNNGAISALAFQTTGQGYGGEINVILGVNERGEILGVRVLSHAETPGLGDKVELEKSSWILGFNGLSLDHPTIDKWKVKKDGGEFDSFSGATITPRAVVNAIKEGLTFYRDSRNQLLIINPVNTSAIETPNTHNSNATNTSTTTVDTASHPLDRQSEAHL